MPTIDRDAARQVGFGVVIIVGLVTVAFACSPSGQLR